MNQLQALPREGSTLYYSLLYTSAEQTTAVVTLLHLCKELAATLHDVTEPIVAEKKVHWWHEEITRLYDGAPRHPTTQAALPFIRAYTIDQSTFWPILEANNSIKYTNSTTDQMFAERLDKDYGTRSKICLSILETRSDLVSPEFSSINNPLSVDMDQAWIPNLIQGLGTFDLLTQFKKLHHRGYPVFPDSDYATAGLNPNDVNSADHADATNQLLSRRIDIAAKKLGRVIAQKTGNINTATLPLLIMAKLRHTQLLLWQRKKLQPQISYTTLTPVKKIWITWRCKQRYLQRD